VIFADTSFLLSLAGNDSNSSAAVARAKMLSEPIVITLLNRLEFENAIALLRFRRALPEAEGIAARDAFEADQEAGRITELGCEWPELMAEALRISRAHSEQAGHRLMDILYIAAALQLKADEFLSFDHRQRALGIAEGLSVGP